MKTAELTGEDLDLWVAKIDQAGQDYVKIDADFVRDYGYHPSTNWKLGGPIIQRERIGVQFEDPIGGVVVWGAGWRGSFPKQIPNDWHHGFGPTPLIAAMRAYVASKFGDEVPD